MAEVKSGRAPALSGAAETDLLAAVLDTVDALILVLDRKGRIQLFNRACERVSGFAAREVQGTPVWDLLLAPEDVAPVRAGFEGLRAADFPGAFENAWVTRTGERRRIRWSNTAIPDAEGQVARVIATGIDVTVQRAAEDQAHVLEQAEAAREALRVSEAKFAGIVSIASDAIISVDEDQRIVLFNTGAERIFGYAVDEVLGRPLDMLIPGRFRRAHRQHVEGFGGGRETARQMAQRSEIYGLRKSGDEFPAEASISKLDIDSGRLYTVMLRDITERKRAEAAQRFLDQASGVLASSLDYEETLVSVARISVQALADFCLVDIVEESGEVRRIGVAHADPAKEDLAAELVRFPLDRKRPHLVFQVLESREPELVETVSADFVERLAQSDEHLRILSELGMSSFVCVPLVAGARMLGAITFVATGSRRFDREDLALAVELGRRAGLAVENARLYRKVHQAVEARDDVLAIVSHDLGNALAAISIGTTMLLREAPDEAVSGAGIQPLDAIRRSVRQMERLIHDLVEVRRLEAGKLALERKAVDVSGLVRESLEMLEPLATVKEIRLEAEVADGLEPLLADRGRLQQVLSNLVGNAVKFTPVGGTIRVAAEPCADGIRLSVRDAGAGIPEGDLPHVFDRFWQAARSGRRGLGLGLSIAKGIVEGHGGRIWVESTVGVGTTFHFVLPTTSTPVAAEP